MKFQVDEKGYYAARQYLLDKYLPHSKLAYVPYTEDYEKKIFTLFLRSNHKLSKRCDWVWNNRVLTRYTFVKAQVIIERIEGQPYIMLGLPASIARSFRRIVLGHMLSARRDLAGLVKKASNLDELYIIAQSALK